MTRKRASRRQFLAAALGTATIGLSGYGSDDSGTAMPGDGLAGTTTATAEPTATPTAEPADTPTATPGAESFVSWPAFICNGEHWGHYPDARPTTASRSIGSGCSIRTRSTRWRCWPTGRCISALAARGPGWVVPRARPRHREDEMVERHRGVGHQRPRGRQRVRLRRHVERHLLRAPARRRVGVLDWDLTSTEDFTPPAVVGRDVYVGSTGSLVHNFNGLDNTQKWDQDTYGAITASTAVADGMIYAPSADHDLYAIPSGGSVEW